VKIHTPTITVAAAGVIVDGGVVVVNEEINKRFALSGGPTTANGWTWRAVNHSEAINLCQGQDGFDTAIAVTQLNRACSDESNCNFLVQEYDNNGRTDFDLSMPELRAPVALSFSIETTEDSGEQFAMNQTVCGIAINEAPTVANDHYLALTSSTRVVEANDPYAILTNDKDDVHDSNKRLTIKNINKQPLYADTFLLRSDGTLRYTPKNDLNIGNDDFLIDSVGITVTDGVFDVESEITIRLVNFNTGPSIASRIPDFVVTVADDEGIAIDLDLSPYFSDIDDDPLQFRMSDNDFENALSLDANGRLTGTITGDDEGSDSIRVFATDGLEEVRDTFRLTVKDERPANNAPEVDDIDNRDVSGSFVYDVSVFFSDPDGDTLSFSAAYLPDDVRLSADGVITGVATDRNRGNRFIEIEATDNRGGSVSDGFRLSIN